MPQRQQEPVTTDFNSITITLANPDTIFGRSRGEVTKPETINYRSFRPERDGLFCEKIFGPTKDWECYCGKYKRVRYKGITCDRCGVEVTTKSVRRERMGHIQLAVPVVHIWFFKAQPSKIGNLLGFNSKELEKIIYYESYVVLNPGPTGLSANNLITEDQYFNILQNLPAGNERLLDTDPNKFIAKIGGEAIKELLKKLDVEMKFGELRVRAKEETSQQKKDELLKRLKILEAFRPKEHKPENRPEWMVLDYVPVIPPELRPLVPLEGGRFATSDLNDLYRRVIIRNNRLRRLIEIKAPEVILRNEKRMLQEAVDALLDNSRRGSAVRGDANRPLKSLSDMLKGKQGRFRQNLLGKRVDYSGRSVIVVGPELRLHQCGLPKDMAVELFKPFIIRKLIERGNNKTVKSAKKVVERKDPIIWEILERIIDGHPILLNRAPTLHRLGIQAFQPVLIDEKAIRLHPMVCTAFNADFDGDQMAVHVPLSHEAQLEAQLLMLSSHNILSPQNGSPIVLPTQDIILGAYFLTKKRKGDKGDGMLFSSPEEVIIAHNNNVAALHAEITVRINGEKIITTPGRIIFNQVVPPEMGYYNEVLVKKTFGSFVGKMYNKLGNKITARFLDDLKDLGFAYAMRGGISISFSDMIIPPEKKALITAAEHKITAIENEMLYGNITSNEKYNMSIDVWQIVENDIIKHVTDNLQRSDHGFNPVFMMLDSGARGSKEQVRQLVGWRGLMHKPQKTLAGNANEIIENPIKASLKEGLTVLEYFISTHGARKGLADTALKTADAGYLTRRLVDVAQDVIISEIDCGTIRGIDIKALDIGEKKESLGERLAGRVAQQVIRDPRSSKIICEEGQTITDEIAAEIEDSGVDQVHIRTVLTCESRHGVCAKCYGRNLTNGKMVEIGEAVGVMAAQSIGEPGTQLTLRTFHTGGSASLTGSAQSEQRATIEGIIKFNKVQAVTREKEGKTIQIVTRGKGRLDLYSENEVFVKSYEVPVGAEIYVQEVSTGKRVKKDELLYKQDTYNSLIVTDISGKVRFNDIFEDITYVKKSDEVTQHFQEVIIEPKDKTLSPSITVTSADGTEKTISLPATSILNVQDGVTVLAGDLLAKIPRTTSRGGDITSGLPRVTELFEARSPQDPAIISEIEGIVKLGSRKKGTREVTITSHDGSFEKKYAVPTAKHLLVNDGDEVNSGERLTDGPINPHDILKIKDREEVQKYLLNEVQEVYRRQGVKINDKHIEVIIRQMLQKKEITNPGDTQFLEKDLVDNHLFLEENDRVGNSFVIIDRGDAPRFKNSEITTKVRIREANLDLQKRNKKLIEFREAEPATATDRLLGITPAALSNESFISAASFQETTKVLANAAIAAKKDMLAGLKENVIMGRLIPAGTGLKHYRDIFIKVEEPLKEGTPVEEKIE